MKPRISYLLFALGVSLMLGSWLLSNISEMNRTGKLQGHLSPNNEEEYFSLGTIENGLDIVYECSFNEVATLSVTTLRLTLEGLGVSCLQWHVGYYIASSFRVRSMAEYFIYLSKAIEGNYSVAYFLSYMILRHDYRDYSTLVFTTGVAITVSSSLSIGSAKYQGDKVVKNRKAISQPKTGNSWR